jgi:hypothetical protein
MFYGHVVHLSSSFCTAWWWHISKASTCSWWLKNTFLLDCHIYLFLVFKHNGTNMIVSLIYKTGHCTNIQDPTLDNVKYYKQKYMTFYDSVTTFLFHQVYCRPSLPEDIIRVKWCNARYSRDPAILMKMCYDTR